MSVLEELARALQGQQPQDRLPKDFQGIVPPVRQPRPPQLMAPQDLPDQDRLGLTEDALLGVDPERGREQIMRAEMPFDVGGTIRKAPMAARELLAAVSSIKSGNNLKSLNASLNKAGDIELSMIEALRRGEGSGSKAMEELVALADNSGKRITLTPDMMPGTTSTARLKKFYRRFGFKPNKGRNADHSISDSFIRDPQ